MPEEAAEDRSQSWRLQSLSRRLRDDVWGFAEMSSHTFRRAVLPVRSSRLECIETCLAGTDDQSGGSHPGRVDVPIPVSTNSQTVWYSRAAVSGVPSPPFLPPNAGMRAARAALADFEVTRRIGVRCPIRRAARADR